MKQLICSATGAAGRAQALKFTQGGSLNSQRVAYWRQGNHAFRMERLPGQKDPTWDNADGRWASARKTVREVLGLA